MSTDVFLTALTSYFVIIDPIGVSLIFNGLARDTDDKQRRTTAVKSIVISFAIIFLFGFYGKDILVRLGISIEAFRISGGLLLLYTAFNMVTRDKLLKLPDRTGQDISVYPMSVPLVAGPGCLTLTILLFSDVQKQDYLSLTLAIVAVLMLTLAGFILSGKIKRLIGNTGDDIIRRLLGVLLAALSIQFIADGIRQI